MVCLVNRGTQDLWSVSTVMDFSMMKLLERSHAHVTANASFSICAYFDSAAVIDLDMNDTGFHVFGASSCKRTA